MTDTAPHDEAAPRHRPDDAPGTSGAASGARSRHRVCLGVIIVVSLGVKLALLLPARAVAPVADSLQYVAAARTLLRRGTFQSPRAPLYPAALAGIFWTARHAGIPTPPPRMLPPGHLPPPSGYDAARVVQVLWSTVAVLLVYLLACTVFDRRAGLAAAGLAAFYPSLVGFSHLLWSETLFILLLLGGLVLAVRGADGRAPVRASLVGAGVCLGLAALTREDGLPVLLWVSLWIVVCGPKPSWSRVPSGLTLLLAGALTVLPWTVRNWFTYRAFVPVTPIAGLGLLYGCTDDFIGEARTLGVGGHPGIEVERAARARAIEIIRADPASWVRRCLTRNLPSLWHPGFDGTLRHIGTPFGYGPLPVWVGRSIVVAVVAAYVLVLALAVAGAVLAPPRRATLLVAGMTALYMLTRTVTSALPRHRLPIMAVACVYAGFLVSRRRGELSALLRPGRIAATLLALVVFGLLVTANDPMMLERVWERAAGGRTLSVTHGIE